MHINVSGQEAAISEFEINCTNRKTALDKDPLHHFKNVNV